jgi:hypothetical protein
MYKSWSFHLNFLCFRQGVVCFSDAQGSAVESECQFWCYTKGWPQGKQYYYIVLPWNHNKSEFIILCYIEDLNLQVIFLHVADRYLFNRPCHYFQNQFGAKDLTTFHSFDNPKGRAIQKAPFGTKSMLAALFIKHKSAKMNKAVRWLAHICLVRCRCKVNGGILIL